MLKADVERRAQPRGGEACPLLSAEGPLGPRRPVPSRRTGLFLHPPWDVVHILYFGGKKRQQNIKVKSLFVSVSKGSWPQGSRTVVQHEEQRGVRDLSHSAGF